MSFSWSSLIGKGLAADCPGQQCKCSPNTFNPSMLPHHVGDTKQNILSQSGGRTFVGVSLGGWALGGVSLGGDHLESSHLEEGIWRRKIWRGALGGVNLGRVRDTRSHCSSSWRHYRHVSLLTSCVNILVALVINKYISNHFMSSKNDTHGYDGQPLYRYLALSSSALDSMTQPFPYCCDLLSLINFSYFRWDEVWVWQKCFGIERKGLLGTKHILLILLTVWGFGQQPIWKCQQPLVIERVANWANWAGANSDELWSVASQTFDTSTPKTDLLSTEASWSTFEQSKQCEKLQLKLNFNLL